MQSGVRKFVTICKGALVERFRDTPAPWRSIAVAAVPAIPWAWRRLHGHFVQLSTPDAPRDAEFAVVPGTSMPGRPHHRVGDRHQDLKDLRHDVDNPAAV